MLAQQSQAGVLERAPEGGYGLTAEGRELLRALEPLSRWAARCAGG